MRNGLLALALTLLVWSPSFAAIRVALQGYSPGAQALGRFALASLAITVLWIRQGSKLPARFEVRQVVFAGALGITGYQVLLGLGEQTVDAGTAALLTALSPLLAVAMAVVQLREHVSARAWAGISLGVVGAALLAVGDGAGSSVTTGALLVLAAAACQAAWVVALKPLLTRHSVVDVTCWTMWAGTALLLPFAPTLARQVPSAPSAASLAVVWLALGATVTGFLAFAAASARLPAVITSASLYLLPVGGALTAWAWLNETPGTLGLVGGALAVTGVVLTTMRSRPRNTVA